MRGRLDLKPGDRVLFIVEADGTVRMRAADKDISSLRGILPPPKRKASIGESEASIAKAAVARHLGHVRD